MRSVLKESAVVLDLPGDELLPIFQGVVDNLGQQGRLTEAQAAAARRELAETEAVPASLGNGIGVFRIPVEGEACVTLVGFRKPHPAADHADIRFCWFIVGKTDDDRVSDDALEPLGWMLKDEHFNLDLLGHAEDDIDHGLLVVYRRYLEHLERVPVKAEVPPELQRTGKLFGGIRRDIARRLPLYGSDFRDGLNTKSFATILFLFFACLAPAIAFGGLMSVLTDGAIGAIEMILGTAICGIVYSLTSGQPLTILGSTGPVVIFIGILYTLCESLGIPFFPTLSWVGMWTSLIIMGAAVTDASSLIRWFTRFTDEIFAGLISIIFVVEAVKDTFSGFGDSGAHDGALASVVLALGTYQLATQLARLRRGPFLRRWAREFLADFGPAIAIMAMTFAALSLKGVPVATLDVPDQFQTTSGRGWLVDPFEAPAWVWGASIVPAVLVSVLLFLDQNITVRIVNNPRYRLKKGCGYHLDLLIVGALVGVCSLFGLPWMVAATVRSLNHVRALATVNEHGGRERIVGVNENRLTAFAVHVLIGVSLAFLSLLEQIPLSVLFGLFLYMGIASMRDNQFFERAQLWVLEPSQYPPTHYLRRVPRRVVHGFTAVQAALLAILWVVKASAVGILFPLFIALLVPMRLLLNRWFKPEHLAFLDAEEERDDDDHQHDEHFV
ncbi:MAG: hypothetical protein JKY37_18335 [Nannocystaceae bacterium]|nr:hypothetical protein [Nannocystaceae bacterium]